MGPIRVDHHNIVPGTGWYPDMSTFASVAGVGRAYMASGSSSVPAFKRTASEDVAVGSELAAEPLARPGGLRRSTEPGDSNSRDSRVVRKSVFFVNRRNTT